MKTKALIKRFFKAIFDYNKKKQEKLYNKLLLKSLKGKHTNRID